MFRKLRTRLILSHTLPILILAPALTLVLFNLLETRNTLGDVANQLIGQATLITAIAEDNPNVWHDPSQAAQLIRDVQPNIASRIMLLNHDGRLLASSLHVDSPRVGQIITFPAITQALAKQTNWSIDYSPYMGTRILDMASPVFNGQNDLIGIVRLSYDVSAIEQRTLPLSGALGSALIVGTALALALGLKLAQSVSMPLVQLAQAVSEFNTRTSPLPLPEVGPDEIRYVASNYNKMTRQLHELEVSRKQLLANIVHELGTSLGAIKAAAEALHNGAVEDEKLASDLALGINRQIDQMRLLIDDLTLLGESEIREIRLNREWCDLIDLIQTQCRIYSYWTEQKHIKLACAVPSDLPPVYVDSQRLAQVLANLLHNAYKYCPEGSKINITARVGLDIQGKPDRAMVDVADNGPGIELQEQDKIFELLYRSPQQRNMNKGMGIGLAVSRRLIEAHGGTIEVRSIPGQGSVFTITISLTGPEGPFPHTAS